MLDVFRNYYGRIETITSGKPEVTRFAARFAGTKIQKMHEMLSFVWRIRSETKRRTHGRQCERTRRSTMPPISGRMSLPAGLLCGLLLTLQMAQVAHAAPSPAPPATPETAPTAPRGDTCDESKCRSPGLTNVDGQGYGYDCWANEYGPLSPWNSPYQAYACAITQDIGFATERKTTSTTLAARPGQPQRRKVMNSLTHHGIRPVMCII